MEHDRTSDRGAQSESAQIGPLEPIPEQGALSGTRCTVVQCRGVFYLLW